MTVEEVILELRQAHRRVPEAALRAAVHHRKTAIPVLLTALETVLQSPNAPDSATLQLATYGTYVLAELREPRAFPLLQQLFALPGPVRDSLTSDMITEDAARQLAATSKGAIEKLDEALTSQSGDSYFRIALFDALIMLVAWGEAKREEVAPVLRRHFCFAAVQQVNPDYNFLGCAVMSALDFGLVEIRDDIRRLLREQPGLEEFVDWDEADLVFRNGAQAGWEFERHPRFRRYGKAHQECAWWHRAEEGER
ncbi:MAG: DUF1186 domain-containing protein [Verrucomicrobia bacterium]|nr:DUF1186 domain-containing protein [Verrucomicrobiota bacterium]